MDPMQPPEPPHLSPLVTQDVNYYCDKTINLSLTIAAYDSMVSTEACAQQDPQFP